MYINQKEIEGWEKKGCGVACAAMVLNIYKKQVSKEEVLKELLDLNGHIEGVGWKHNIIARVLANNNVLSYNQEFTKPNNNTSLFDNGMEKIKKELNEGNLVIVSIYRNFDCKEKKGGHLVLITKIEDDSFIIKDPDYEYGKDGIKINTNTFKECWRGFAIFTKNI